MAEAAGDIFGPIDAETGDTTQWSSTVVDAGMTFEASTSADAHGTYGFNCAGGTNNDARGVKTFTDCTQGYFRFYLYIPSTLDGADSGETLYICCLRDGAVELVDFIVRRTTTGTGAFEEWRIVGEGLPNTSSTTNFSLDAWHYIDIYWYAGTGANGGATIWVDGTEILSNLDSDLTAYAADTITIGFQGYITEDGEYLYIDDVKGDTGGRIGEYAESGGYGFDARIAGGVPVLYLKGIST